MSDADVPPEPVDEPVGGVSADELVEQPAAERPAQGSTLEKPAARRPRGARHTRISGAWTAVIVAIILGIALIDFIVQNTRSVRVEFFSVSGTIPVAVALLVAAVAGAFVVLAIGVARITQLRLAARRDRSAAAAASDAPLAAPRAES